MPVPHFTWQFSLINSSMLPVVSLWSWLYTSKWPQWITFIVKRGSRRGNTLGPVLEGGVTELLKVHRPVHQVCLIIISFLSDSSSERIERRGRVSDRLVLLVQRFLCLCFFVLNDNGTMLLWKADRKFWDAYKLEKGKLVAFISLY